MDTTVGDSLATRRAWIHRTAAVQVGLRSGAARVPPGWAAAGAAAAAVDADAAALASA